MTYCTTYFIAILSLVCGHCLCFVRRKQYNHSDSKDEQILRVNVQTGRKMCSKSLKQLNCKHQTGMNSAFVGDFNHGIIQAFSALVGISSRSTMYMGLTQTILYG